MEVLLKSAELKQYIYRTLNKKDSEVLTDEECREINRIVLNAKNFFDEDTDCKVSDLSNFPKLEQLIIRDFNINNEDIDTLNSLPLLHSVQFDLCKLEFTNKLTTKIPILIFANCNEIDLNLIDTQYTTTLQIIGADEVSLEFIHKFNDLQRLLIQESKVKDIDNLIDLPRLEEINFDGSEVENEEDISELKSKIDYSHEEEFLPIE